MNTIDNVTKTLNNLYVAQEALHETGDLDDPKLDHAMMHISNSIQHLESWRRSFIKFKKELGL